MNFAIIPARVGSKRIPRKNIKEFCGQPMISWSIQSAMDSGCFDKIIVSTDDEEIAEVARTYGAEVPFVRPAESSNDHAGTIPVIAHAIVRVICPGLGLPAEYIEQVLGKVVKQAVPRGTGVSWDMF